MTEIKHNISLKEYNTFGIDIKAKLFCFYKNYNDIKFLINNNIINNNSKILILGEGSNLLFTKNFDGLVIYPINKDVNIEQETDNEIFIEAGAGKKWDDLVSYTVNKGYGGLENLSGIPGNVGATPVQNIGAYGVEAKDIIYKVNVIDLQSGQKRTLLNNECNFNYRSSIFKNEFKNKFLVNSVVFKLQKKPVFKTHYGSIQNVLMQQKEINLKTIRQSILKIRDEKLPDPKIIGNAGSFFKNPIISNLQAKELQKEYNNMVCYPLPNNKTKVAAGWLIDQAGLKGYTDSNNKAGIHKNQALVLINKGNATGQDIVSLSDFVKKTILQKFNINLEPEVIRVN